ncbi:MAG TPA: ATP-binding protein [Acidimicrobiales bacterium]|nr:ATP-binding protein [Acidimicrobiales bacterium]
MLQRAEIDCAADPQAVRHARSFVASTLRSWRLPDLVETAELLVSEVVTNAILHAASPFRLTVECRTPRMVSVEVRDSSGAAPVLTSPAQDATHGRGLLLIELLASRWGWRPVEGGKVVWFELTG